MSETKVMEANNTVTWKGSGVHVSAIERELTQLWKEKADVASGGDAQRIVPVTRTRVLNLIGVTTSTDGANRMKETVGHLSGQHPSRTVLVISHADTASGAGSLDAEISATRLSTGKQTGDHCWELIQIDARGRAAFHLSSVVYPLLVADLPTFLWWSGEPPFESHLFSSLVDIAHKVMVDSLSFSAPYEQDLPKLYRLVKKRSDKVAFSDFNWMRIRSWVELTAQFFDSPQFRPFINGIEKVSIQYEAFPEDPHPNPMQGLLYTGWLGSRLGWETRPGRKRLPHGGWNVPMASASGKDISTDVQASEAHRGAQGEIFAVTLEASAGGRKGRFSISRDQDRAHATTNITVEGLAPVTKVVEMSSYTDADLLTEEMHDSDRDRAYEDALEMASAMMGGPKKAKKGKKE